MRALRRFVIGVFTTDRLVDLDSSQASDYYTLRLRLE
jgi:hypothetical protein